MTTTQGGMLHSLRAVHALPEQNADKVGAVANTHARQRFAAEPFWIAANPPLHLI